METASLMLVIFSQIIFYFSETIENRLAKKQNHRNKASSCIYHGNRFKPPIMLLASVVELKFLTPTKKG